MTTIKFGGGLYQYLQSVRGYMAPPITALPMALGLVHGVLITRLRVQAFIVTLCGSSSLNFDVMGAVVLVGVLADQLLQRRRQKQQVRSGTAAPAEK